LTCVAGAAFAFGAAILPASVVRADETYLCEGGRMVTVRFGELEALSRTDPCIAEHLAKRGRNVGATLPVAPSQSAAVIAGGVMTPPLPERRPHYELMPDAGGEMIVHHEAPPADASTPAQPSRSLGVENLRPRVQQIAFRQAAHRIANSTALPTGPADFRRVPIINAEPGAPAVFHHTR
jgi:hypothetical protein